MMVGADETTELWWITRQRLTSCHTYKLSNLRIVRASIFFIFVIQIRISMHTDARRVGRCSKADILLISGQSYW